MDIVDDILSIPNETIGIEFKRLLGDGVIGKCIESIVAFANTEGGFLILGVDDPEKTKFKGLDRVLGIEEHLENFDALGREIQKIAPPLANIWPPQKILTQETGKTIGMLRIPKSEHHFHACNNHVFIRQEKGNKRLSPQEIVKFSYAKGFELADRELVDVDFDLLETDFYKTWKQQREISTDKIEQALLNIGLARKNVDGKIQPTRAAVLLFAEHPTYLMSTKCAVRIFQYEGTIEKFAEVPNYIGTPKTIEGPIIKLIKDAHEYVLSLLRAGIKLNSGFVNKYKVPERAITEAITNAVIHRDYHIKRDIEIRIFEDRVEIESPGLFPCNITRYNIGRIRADGYRNDLLVKHLREFPFAPNFDQNEGVRAMRAEMRAQNLYPPIYLTYPLYEDAVKVILFNEIATTEWDKVQFHLTETKFINNEMARKLTGITNPDKMSKLFKKWVEQGLLVRIDPPTKSTKGVKYKLAGAPEVGKLD